MNGYSHEGLEFELAAAIVQLLEKSSFQFIPKRGPPSQIVVTWAERLKTYRWGSSPEPFSDHHETSFILNELENWYQLPLGYKGCRKGFIYARLLERQERERLFHQQFRGKRCKCTMPAPRRKRSKRKSRTGKFPSLPLPSDDIIKLEIFLISKNVYCVSYLPIHK